MAVHSKLSTSPISISSRISSPQAQAIEISSGSPDPDIGRLARTAYWAPPVIARHPTEISRFTSRAPSVVSAHSSIPDADLAMEIELRDLRNRCAELEAKNNELEGRVAAWS